MPAAAWALTITAALSMRRAKWSEYAAALERALGDFDGRLLIEPGRFLVAQAGALVARVLYVKRNGKKTFVITDAAMNDLIRPALYQAHHEIVPVRPRAGKPRIVDVVGPVCESGDFFARDRKLAPVEPGDLVALLDAGRLRHGAKLELQLAPATGRGAGRRRKGAAHPPARDHGRSACAGRFGHELLMGFACDAQGVAHRPAPSCYGVAREIFQCGLYRSRYARSRLWG